MAIGRLGGGLGGDLGMGIMFTLGDGFTDPAKRISMSMEQLSAKSEGMAANLAKPFERMAKIGGLMSVGGGIGSAFFNKAANIRAQFQAYEVQFETLLGSAGKAQEFVAKIKKDAADNPIFGTKSLVAANAALVSTGNVAEEQSRRITNNLAEILSGVGGGDEELQRMAVNLQQIGNNGKATSLDVKQFGMAGVPIMKILADSMGKTTKELEGMDITLEQLDKAFAHATSKGQMFYGATERAAMSMQGLKAAAEDAAELTMESIGKSLEPLFRKMYMNIEGILNKVKAFVDSPLGGYVVRITAVTLGLVTALGVLITTYAGLRLAMLQTTKLFAPQIRYMALARMQAGSLSGALRLMGRAAWASLGPYAILVAILVAFVVVAKKAWNMMMEGDEKTVSMATAVFALLGPIGMLVGLVAGITRGFQELKKPLDEMPTTGVLGFFTKLAAIIEFVRQVWSSWDGETFAFTEDLQQRLEKLGILDFALQIGEVIAHIKEFFAGVALGLKPVQALLGKFKDFIKDQLLRIFNQLRESGQRVWATFSKAFKPVADLLDKIMYKLFGASDSLNTWKAIGWVVGKTIVSVFERIFEAITFVIDVVVTLITYYIQFVEIMTRAYIKVVEFFSWLYNNGRGLVIEFIAWLLTLPIKFFNAGVEFGKSLLDGIKNSWTALTEWVSQKVQALVESIVNPLKKAWDFAKTGGGLWGGDNDNDNPVPRGTPSPVGSPSAGGKVGSFFSHHKTTSKSPVIVNNAPAYAPQDNMQPIIVQNWMDGDLVSEKMIERQELMNARKS